MDREDPPSTARAHELRGLLDALPLATGVKDREGRFLYVNAAAAAGYGRPVAELLGALERDVLPAGNDAEAVLAADREVIDSGRPLTLPGHKFSTFEGRTMVLHMTREPVHFQGLRAVLVTAMDVTDLANAATERRQLERRIAEAQRLDGLGLLAGGIAHDFNNLLVGVLGNAELALQQVSAGSPVQHFVERIRSAAGRLAELANQMLTYSGHSPTRIQAVDFALVVREMLDFTSSSIPPHVKVELDLASELPLVAGDSAQLGQVVVNLVLNACEAIGTRPGRVKLSARREFLDSARSASLTVRAIRGAADYVCFEVADDGRGMDEATRARIFDPFFSTKGTRGRGLGLASVIGIVRAHQGALKVDTSPGAGTRMRMWLPLAQELERARARSITPRPAAPTAGRRVLVIDDEAVVRETASALLEMHGYTVLAVSDAESALAVARSAGDFDVVMLDMTMPGSSAEDVHEQVRGALPEAGILLVSGFSEPSMLRRLLERPRTRFLEKPFRSDVLAAEVQALLRA